MKWKNVIAGVAVGTVGLFAGQAAGQADVIVGDVAGVNQSGGVGPGYWGFVGDTMAFSLGTTSCNVGDVNLNWFANGTAHPVIAQNLYRIKEGRMEMLGMSWVKHGFCALQQTLCGSCTPAGGGCASRLGVGCSDPYSASLNGDQGGLGPRSEVNASTGAFIWPYGARNQSGDAIYKRIQVKTDDVTAALNPDALYVTEGIYIAADDALAGNGGNNASYRLATLGPGVSSGGNRLNFAGSTVREQPAIVAWRDHGLGINTPDPDVTVTSVSVPGDGDFWIATKVTENNDGTWRYEYAIENLNSHRSGGSFSVPLPAGATASDLFFNDVDYHSGEPYDNTDWAGTVGSGSVSWASPQTFASNPNSNALRWGTMYNFGFTSNAAPVAGEVELGHFIPGIPLSTMISTTVPGSAGCSAADIVPDGEINIDDVIAFLDAFADQTPAADLADPIGAFNIDDVIAYLDLFALGCP